MSTILFIISLVAFACGAWPVGLLLLLVAWMAEAAVA